MVDAPYLNQLANLEQQNGLPSGLLSTQMMAESGGDPTAVSPAGAQGAFQFMPATAAQYGIDPMDPNASAVAAASMMGGLLKKYNGDLPSALAAYNWGQGNVDKKGLDNAPTETQDYIKKITSALNPVSTAQAGELPNLDSQFKPDSPSGSASSSDTSNLPNLDAQFQPDDKPGYFARVGNDFNQNLQEQATSNNQIGQTSPALNLLNAAAHGTTALIGAPIGEAVGSLLNYVPQDAKDAIVKGIGSLPLPGLNMSFTKGAPLIGDTIKGAGNALGQIYGTMQANAPKTTQALTDIGQTALNLLPLAGGAEAKTADAAVSKPGNFASAAEKIGKTSSSGTAETPELDAANAPPLAIAAAAVPDAPLAPISGTTQKAIKVLNKNLGDIDPEQWQQNYQRGLDLGLPVVPMDALGEDVNGKLSTGGDAHQLIDATVNMPGGSRSLALQVASRSMEQPARVANALSEALAPEVGGKVPALYDVMQQAQNVQKAASPAYEAAYTANKAINSPQINKILATPAGQNALSAARVKMQNDMSMMGAPDAELGQQARDAGITVPGGVADGLNMRTLDYVKRAMDDQIGQSANPASASYSRDNVRILTGLKNGLLDQMDSADVTAKNGQPGLYAQARKQWGSQQEILSALEQGRDYKSMDPEEIEQFMSDPKVSDPAKQAFRTGAVRANFDAMRGTGVQDGTNIIGKVFNLANQDRLAKMFPSPEQAKLFNEKMAFERRMATTDQHLQGSQTFGRQQVAQDIAQTGENNIIQHVGDATAAAVDPLAGARAFVQKATTKLANARAAGISNDVAKNITEIVLGKSPTKIMDIQRYAKSQGVQPSVIFKTFSQMPDLPPSVRESLAPVLTEIAPKLRRSATVQAMQQGKGDE